MFSLALAIEQWLCNAYVCVFLDEYSFTNSPIRIFCFPSIVTGSPFLIYFCSIIHHHTGVVFNISLLIWFAIPISE